MQSDLDSIVALVTGASGGIGSAIARHFVAESARVVAHGFCNQRALESLVGELGGRAIKVLADLRDEGQVEAMYAEALGAVGRIDCLVVNAGVWVEEPVPLHEMSLQQWRQTIESDLTSAFLTCRGFLRHLARQPRPSASIVFIASTAALFGEADHADYAAAKAAMAYGLTRTLKNEIVRLAPRGRVNCVCPGWTLTPLTEPHVADQALLDRVFATMPLRKLATADDVAAAVVFLASDRLAGHLTGTILPVAGGMEGRRLQG